MVDSEENNKLVLGVTGFRKKINQYKIKEILRFAILEMTADDRY